MSVFVSYSHEDKEFVDRLATELIKKKARLWIDRWEINVGESLVEKIQSAISEAEALLVILSKASVDSEWFKRELSAGVIRELVEKRVLILPILIDDCKIPLLLQDKKY